MGKSRDLDKPDPGVVFDLVALGERLHELDKCTRPPTVDELEELDPKELARLLHLCSLF